MKKIIAILLVAMMALSLVACGEKPAPTPDPDPTTGTYKTGLGMVVSMSGTDAEDEDPAKTQADVTVCEATFDQDGKIVAVSFDVAQCKALLPSPRTSSPSVSWAMITTWPSTLILPLSASGISRLLLSKSTASARPQLRLPVCLWARIPTATTPLPLLRN